MTFDKNYKTSFSVMWLMGLTLPLGPWHQDLNSDSVASV